MKDKIRIGFISTRLAGTDGVSLETQKWGKTLDEMGHEIFYLAGESEYPAERSRVVAEAHFDHQDVRSIYRDLFLDGDRTEETTEKIHGLRGKLKKELKRFLDDFGVELLIVENALSIPMNVPLGIALTELLTETRACAIAHHHDFAWERPRFAVNQAEDILQAAFPPAMPSIQHVVINTHAATELARRTGMRSTLIPNVMDFENPPGEADDYADDMKEALGVDEDEAFLLQPTRIVPRKRIERAIELARSVHLPCALVVSHSAGDEGYEYQDYLRDYAEVMGVKLIFADWRLAQDRGETEGGEKVYSLADAYRRADLVTYPSRIEGFGNAFLEAIYYKAPLMMSDYEIFKVDVRPKGFQVVSFGEFLSRETVEHARRLLKDGESAREMVEHNFKLGRKHYSFSVLRERLTSLLGSALEQAF